MLLHGVVTGWLISAQAFVCCGYAHRTVNTGSRLCNIEKEFCSEKHLKWRYLTKKCDELDVRTAVTRDLREASAGRRLWGQVENQPCALVLRRPLLR